MTDQISKLKRTFFAVLSTLTVALWLVGILTIIRTLTLAYKTDDESVRWIVGIVGIIFAVLLLCLVSVLPSAVRTRRLRRQKPHAVVVNALSSLDVRNQFEKGSLKQALIVQSARLVYMFTLVADKEGITFWNGLVHPSLFAKLTWQEVANVSTIDSQIVSQRMTMLRVTLLDGGSVEFVVNQDQFFGLFRRGKRSMKRLAAMVNSMENQATA
jgi:hypothetical protein